MLIVVIAVYTLLPLPGHERRKQGLKRLEGLLPYLLVTALYFWMRAYSLKGLVGTSVPIDGIFSRLYQNYHIIPQYLGLLLVPVDLTLFHKVPQGGIFTPAWFFPAWLALFFAVWLIIRSRNRAAIFCLVWFVINYTPISNIVPIPSDQMTERYLYMPAAGFFILLGALFSWASANRIITKAFWGGLIVISVTFAVLSFHRNLDWKNNLSLFSSGARNDPMSPAAHYNLGTAYQEQADMESARREWEKTLALRPDYADALTQMGTLAAVQGDLEKAEQYYNAALKAPLGVADPDKAMAHYNLGKIYEKWRQPERALSHYEQFMKEVPITYLEYIPDAEKRIQDLRSTMPSVPIR